MKWFHHECAAKHDPKLQTLGASFGAEGLGMYWGILEEIGQHSEAFHLKVIGISEEIDKKFTDLQVSPPAQRTNPFRPPMLVDKVPKIPLRILARILFASPKKLKAMIETSVEIGLFDSAKWHEYNVLYSPSFEQRADDYTRRQQRKSDTLRPDASNPPDVVRTQSEQSSDSVRTISANVPLEQTTEQEEESEVDQMKRRQEHLLLAVDSQGKINVETDERHAHDTNGHFLIEPSPEEFRMYFQKCSAILCRWNQTHVNPFAWTPTDSEMKKLFYGGDREHKLRMCYQAYNLQGDKINYPELVLRAIRLMLKSSEKHRIVNPLGWLWSCLHGNGDGTTPWVQLLTADEEKTGSSTRTRSRVDESMHPP